MNSYELLGALNALYDVNDQMGVELMGEDTWNGLKKAVAIHTSNVLNSELCGEELLGAWANKTMKTKSSFAKARKSAIDSLKGKTFKVQILEGDQLTNQLFGFNDEVGEELLGGWWTNLKNSVADATHKVLNVGSKIPVVDAAVQRVRDITNAVKGGSTAVSVANSAYENRGKLILIGCAGGFLLYLLLRKKK